MQIATWISCVEKKGSLIGETASCGAVKKQELLKKQEKTTIWVAFSQLDFSIRW